MPTNKSKPTGRTPWDLASDVLARKSILLFLAITAWLLLVGVAYLWHQGKIGFTSANQTDGTTLHSPFVHWWSAVTKTPIPDYKAFTGAVYDLVGTTDREAPDVDEASVAQVGVAGSVTSVIICVRTGEKTTVVVMSSGPEQTATKNREAQLCDAVKASLHL